MKIESRGMTMRVLFVRSAFVICRFSPSLKRYGAPQHRT
jgi:hypothetical protein